MKIFQEDNVDVTLFGITIDHILNILKKYLCMPNSFVEGAVHLTKLLEDSKDGFLENVDKEETIHRHVLLHITIQDKEMSQPMLNCIDGSFENYI
jgi:hypothetical protein